MSLNVKGAKDDASKKGGKEADDDDMIYMLPLMMLRRCGLCRECKHLIEN